MLFLEEEEAIDIHVCVVFSVRGCRNGEEGNPFEGCPYSFFGRKAKKQRDMVD